MHRDGIKPMPLIVIIETSFFVILATSFVPHENTKNKRDNRQTNINQLSD